MQRKETVPQEKCWAEHAGNAASGWRQQETTRGWDILQKQLQPKDFGSWCRFLHSAKSFFRCQRKSLSKDGRFTTWSVWSTQLRGLIKHSYAHTHHRHFFKKMVAAERKHKQLHPSQNIKVKGVLNGSYDVFHSMWILEIDKQMQKIIGGRKRDLSLTPSEYSLLIMSQARNRSMYLGEKFFGTRPLKMSDTKECNGFNPRFEQNSYEAQPSWQFRSTLSFGLRGIPNSLATPKRYELRELLKSLQPFRSLSLLVAHRTTARLTLYSRHHSEDFC